MGEPTESPAEAGTAEDGATDDDGIGRRGDSPRDDTRYGGRDRSPKPVLRSIAVQAAVLSAAAHILWAWPRFGTDTDPRPATFLLAAAFTVLIAVATVRGGEYRRLYALGAGTLAAFLVGFLLWHRTAPIEALVGDPYALVGKAAEGVGVIAFVALYRLAPPTAVALERLREDAERTGPEE
ncbi:hypothetical protein SAMN05192561_10393 [Halopenitus malekzadehii]|uniref:Uncharacterized protein n=1 Tax=Halopenitus malekzadehii TaxID=1267564 RepID=A0A1H6IPZ5_9EURY|nr:hypothetical protein [Halopenitus malekzadehii]SEH49568.1 hypothetical protein SAMN05192561_10393 [Halopenitus malekzadehii]